MRHTLGKKLNTTRGISRLMAILLVLVIVMCVVVSIPTARYYWREYRAGACAAGLDTARRRLAEQFMYGSYSQSAREAKEAVAYAMVGWDDLCPSGGKVYLVETETGDPPYDLVCGYHDPDANLRTRLNSGYVLEQLQDALLRAEREDQPIPDTITFRLNGKRWKAWRTDSRCDFKWGTDIARGLEKLDAAAYYGVAGQGDFTAGHGVEEGEICYFTFAERYSFATWRAGDGWTGGAYAARK